MTPLRRRAWVTAAALLLSVYSVVPASAQGVGEVTPEVLSDVFPNALRFGEKSGEPPVIEAYGTDPASGVERLIGYVFLTSDLPPEVQGYTAPVDVLVGLDLEGRLTGIELIHYRESLMSSRGDFLNRGSYLVQFETKHVADPFRVRRDIDGISGATITVDAMSRGIRNAARRVAATYLAADPPDETQMFIGTVPFGELEGLLWAEMLIRGLSTQLSIDEGPIRLALSMTYLTDPAVGDLMVGSTYFRSALDSLGTRDPEPHLMLMGLGGENPFFFRTSGLSIIQEADTLRVDSEDLVMLPLLREGKLQGEVRRTAVVYVDPSLDLSEPFVVSLDLAPRGGSSSSVYRVLPPEPMAVAGSPQPASGSDADAAALGGGAVTAAPDGTLESAANELDGGSDTLGETSAVPSSDQAAGAAPPVGGVTIDDSGIDYDALLLEEEDEVEQSALARVLERTSWARVGGFLVLLTLATWTLIAKTAVLRWVTLALTFLVLGYVDGGFLSVSHIMAGISVGPSVYLGDLPLFLLVSFTVLTTLFWGRVFCGFLCPFGALQDLLERFVPKRFQRELPRAFHERAVWVKYAILGLVLAPPILGSSLSLFQYFEPFGTVFYWSSSFLLWSIAAVILVAAAIVPRFYCRYACPLGAALAIGSLLAPFRIRRVEQCDICKVCEQKCPTGAIDGPTVDFKECVRCNTCEVQLIERTGACRHDMDDIRSRLRLPMVDAGAPSA